MAIVKVKTCPFGCDIEYLRVFDRGAFVECSKCGIKFDKGLKAWNKRKRGAYIVIEY
jgi:hypothetical protein